MKKFLVIFLSLLAILTFSNIFYANLHSHTSYSDGKLFPEDAYNYAKNYVDVLAVTDHAYYFEQLIDGKTKTYLTKLAAENATIEGEFLALQGFEWTSGVGHINVYESLEWIDRNQESSVEGFYKWLVEHKKLGQFNHPIKLFGTFDNFVYYPQADLYMNLIEVGNGNWSSGDVISNEMLSNYKLAIQKGWHLGATVGQDNHKPNWGSANEGRTGIITPNLTYDDIMSALWSRHTFGSEDKDVKINFSYDNFIMGDIVVNPPKRVSLKFEYSDNDKISYFALVSQSGTIVELNPNVTNYSTSITIEIPDGYEWYFCYIKQNDGDEIVTSPIWFQVDSDVFVNNMNFANNALFFDVYNVTNKTIISKLEIVTDNKVLYSENVDLNGYEIKSKMVKINGLASGTHTLKFLVNGICVQSYNIDIKEYKQTIMIDILHENDHLDRLKKFGEFLSKKGYNVVYSKRMLNKLDNIDVLIIATPKKDGFDFSKDLLAPELKELSEFDGEIILIPGSDEVYFNLYKQKLNGEILSIDELFERFGFVEKSNKVFIDIGHLNDYNRSKLSKIETFLKEFGLNVEYIEKLEKIDRGVLIIQNGRGYSENEVKNIVKFVQNGGKLIITSKSDYKDGGNTKELNYILEKLGVTTRFNDDQVVDFENNYGAPFKVLVNNVRFYSSCSLIIGENTKIILSSKTAKNEDKDGNNDAVVLNGDVVLAAEEDIGLGKVIILGKSVFSDYDFDYNKEFILNIILN